MDDLKLIKKYYGEEMMHKCRELFPTLLETPGLLYKLLSENFNESKLLYEDLKNENAFDRFRDYIYLTNERQEEVKESKNTPFELLDKAGYILYECKTESDIQSFRHYYKRDNGETPIYKEGTKPELRNGEELCTFNGNRLDSCYVFFAVKKNVDEIKRENFPNPERQDEYGTSVISIQITKSSNMISVKNRYNHTVKNPDATFSNNLENIIEGLTDSINKYLDLSLKILRSCFDLTNYVRADDGKHYKYNSESMNIYFCPNNIMIKDYRVIRYDKSRYILIDQYLLDMQEKTIKTMGYSDSFCNSIGMINKIEQQLNKKTGSRRIIINKNIIIEINKYNQLIGYINPNVEEIDTYFLFNNKTLKYMSLENVKEVGKEFMSCNDSLEELYMPNVVKISNNFLMYNVSIKELCLPSVKEIGKSFLERNGEIKTFEAPRLTRLDNFSLYSARNLERLVVPELETIGNNVLVNNDKLAILDLPNIREIGTYFLVYNKSLRYIYMPNLISIGERSLASNYWVKKIYAPNLPEKDKKVLRKHLSIFRKFSSIDKINQKRA